MTYKIAGMESFQQSALNTSRPNFLKRPINREVARKRDGGEAAATARLDFASKVYSPLDAVGTEVVAIRVLGVSGSVRIKAMMSEMDPFRSSLRRTAAPAE